MRAFIIFQICALLFWGEALGIQWIDVGNTEGSDFDLLYSETGKGLSFQVLGESLIVNGDKKEKSTKKVALVGEVQQAWLIWSGELSTEESTKEKIIFLTPNEKERALIADKIWVKKSSGILYVAAADVTKYIQNSGIYGIKGLPSEPLLFHSNEKFSIAGWVLCIVEQQEKHDEKSIQILASLQILRPGEIYDFDLKKTMPNGNWHVRKIALIGGHGRAGNGSASLLNGKALQGIDEWNGSSGIFWDIDTFHLGSRDIQTSKDGLVLTIDPLLQWLYPVAVAIESEVLP